MPNRNTSIIAVGELGDSFNKSKGSLSHISSDIEDAYDSETSGLEIGGAHPRKRSKRESRPDSRTHGSATLSVENNKFQLH